ARGGAARAGGRPRRGRTAGMGTAGAARARPRCAAGRGAGCRGRRGPGPRGARAMTVDHVALLPAYAAVLTAVAVFLADLVAPGRRGPVLVAGSVGCAVTAVLAWVVGRG